MRNNFSDVNKEKEKWKHHIIYFIEESKKDNQIIEIISTLIDPLFLIIKEKINLEDKRIATTGELNCVGIEEVSLWIYRIFAILFIGHTINRRYDFIGISAIDNIYLLEHILYTHYDHKGMLL